MEDAAFWRVHCHVGQHPGQWQRWFREQCCAVGWHPSRWGSVSGDGWSLHELDDAGRAFVTTANHLARMRVGDWVVATLPHHRVGRLGRIFEMRVRDDEWDPIIPPTRDAPFGENGRRILVRWQLDVGPQEPSQVVALPTKARLNQGQVRGTIRRLEKDQLEEIRSAMLDESNWVSLDSSFDMEVALSAYIALHPHSLEQGLTSYPDVDVTEHTFGDGRRADVILRDSTGGALVVECKQGAASVQACKQVEHYRKELAK